MTHPNTSHIRPYFVQKWDHMSPLGDGAFNTRVEDISRKEGESVGLTGKARIGAIVIHEGLETRDTTDRFS